MGGSFNLYIHHRGCLNNTIFSNSGLCAACWAHFMCPHELWPTSVSHPFSSLNGSLGLTGGKYYQKITIPIIRFILQNFVFPGCFSYILFYRSIFSLQFPFGFLQCVALFQSMELIKYSKIAELPSPMTSQLYGCPHIFVVLFLFLFFLKVICGP